MQILYARVSIGEILEEKNRAVQVIVAKTRGQATVLAAEGWQKNRITAKAGIKVPDYEDDHNDYFVMLYLERHPSAKTDASSLTSTREMMLKEKDLIMNHRMQRMNLEPDCKRRLVNPRMVPVLDRMHLACDSEPHQSLEVGEHYRTRFDSWRPDNCLTAENDWDNWEDHIETSLAKRHSDMRQMVSKGEKSDGILRRLFIRAYARESHGLKRAPTYRQFAGWLTENGYNTTEAEARGGKRAKLYFGVVPVTTRTVTLLRLILTKFPDFKYEPFFNPDRLSELHRRLAELD